MATYTQRKEPKRTCDKVHEKAKRALLSDIGDDAPECAECGEPYHPKRKALGYPTCLDCGEPKREFAVVPVPKSNYIVASSLEQVKSPYSHKGNR